MVSSDDKSPRPRNPQNVARRAENEISACQTSLIARWRVGRCRRAGRRMPIQFASGQFPLVTICSRRPGGSVSVEQLNLETQQRRVVERREIQL